MERDRIIDDLLQRDKIKEGIISEMSDKLLELSRKVEGMETKKTFTEHDFESN